MKEDVSHSEISEHDKAYFTEDIISPGNDFQKIVAKAVLNSSQINTSNKENLYNLDVVYFHGIMSGLRNLLYYIKLKLISHFTVM